jgi:pantoate--beta-alanine ligase
LANIDTVPELASTIAGIRESIGQAKTALVAAGTIAPRVALVPTMGALHPGHLALAARAAELGDIVVVSVFVNPTQFTVAADLDRYPRDLDADVAALEGTGATFVFAPTAAEMYPAGPTATTLSAGEVGSLFEGKSRPGHFDAVLTVVSKLLHIVGPDAVVFGQKDAQQAFVVGRMLRDLDFPVSLEVVPTVRESDGLALSSRNRFLDARERRASLVLSRMLEAAESAADGGADAAIAAAQSVVAGESLVQLDYFTLVHPDTFLPVDSGHHGEAIAIVAAQFGSTRLIDNQRIHLP